jgi:hypothetical protein
MFICVRDVASTAKKHQNQNAERNFVSKISLKNYKCRLHILQQQQKYVHTKILFSVYIRRVKINFILCCCCIVVRSWQNFTLENEFCILDCRHFYWKWKQIFLSQTTENENENMCSLCQNVCFCEFFACVFVAGCFTAHKRRMIEREI